MLKLGKTLPAGLSRACQPSCIDGERGLGGRVGAGLLLEAQVGSKIPREKTLQAPLPLTSSLAPPN